MQPMAQGKPPTRNRPCLISSLSALVDGNLMKSPSFAAKACVTRRTTRLAVDLSKPKKVSPITWRNEPEAKNLRVTKTCISAETACKSAFYHLRNISRIRKLLSTKTIETLVHAFVTSNLDHCNSLLYGVLKYVIKKLQSPQNAAA